MSKAVLFGGPFDGRVIASVPDERDVIRLPVLEPVTLSSEEMPPKPVIPDATYKRLIVGGQKRTWFLFDE